MARISAFSAPWRWLIRPRSAAASSRRRDDTGEHAQRGQWPAVRAATGGTCAATATSAGCAGAAAVAAARAGLAPPLPVPTRAAVRSAGAAAAAAVAAGPPDAAAAGRAAAAGSRRRPLPSCRRCRQSSRPRPVAPPLPLDAAGAAHASRRSPMPIWTALVAPAPTESEMTVGLPPVAVTEPALAPADRHRRRSRPRGPTTVSVVVCASPVWFCSVNPR